MTLDEYMDPKRFPLTTQVGLVPRDQMLRDAINYDDGVELRELGEPFTDEMNGRWAELDVKVKAQADVLRQLKAREKAEAARKEG